MKQIPSVLWNMTDDVVEITVEDGDRWHLIQTLIRRPHRWVLWLPRNRSQASYRVIR